LRPRRQSPVQQKMITATIRFLYPRLKNKITVAELLFHFTACADFSTAIVLALFGAEYLKTHGQPADPWYSLGYFLTAAATQTVMAFAGSLFFVSVIDAHGLGDMLVIDAAACAIVIGTVLLIDGAITICLVNVSVAIIALSAGVFALSARFKEPTAEQGPAVADNHAH